MDRIKESDWEWIDEEQSMRRLRVTGGWLVRVDAPVMHDQTTMGRGMEGGWDWRPAITFLFDPQHQWGKEPTK